MKQDEGTRAFIFNPGETPNEWMIKTLDAATGEWRDADAVDLSEHLYASASLVGITQEQITRLKDLMRELAPDCDERRFFALANPLVMFTGAKVQDRNEGRKRGKNKSLIELRKLAKLTDDLGAHMSELGTEASFALKDRLTREGVARIVEALGTLHDASASAHAAISDARYTPAPQTPKKTARLFVAGQARSIFENLTGKRATISTRDGKAYGPFLEFLSKLFTILQIDGSPEAAWRDLRKKGAQGAD